VFCGTVVGNHWSSAKAKAQNTYPKRKHLKNKLSKFFILGISKKFQVPFPIMWRAKNGLWATGWPPLVYWLRQMAHDQEVLGTNPATIHWMEVSNNASYYTSGSQPLCRGTKVCRGFPPSVPQDLRIMNNNEFSPIFDLKYAVLVCTKIKIWCAAS
jgi:hypothetical protein